MADPNQTPGPDRFQWACPCAGCSKAIAFERKQLIELFEQTKNDYLVYRGSSFHKDTGELMWAKDDAMAYAEGINTVIELIKERMPKPKPKRQ